MRRTNRPRAPRLQATFPPGSAFSHPGPYGSFAHDDQYCYPWLNALWPAHSVLMTSALRVESPAVGAPDLVALAACRFGFSSIPFACLARGSDRIENGLVGSGSGTLPALGEG